MRSLIVTAALVLLGFAPSAHAEPAPVNNLARVNPCQPVTYRYLGSAEHRGVARVVDKAMAADAALSGIAITKAAPGQPAMVTLHWGRLDRDTLGLTVPNTQTMTGWEQSADITLNDRHVLIPRRTRALVMHEMGHALGLGHSEAGNRLMSPRLNQTRVTPDDRAAFASLRAAGCEDPIQVIHPTVVEVPAQPIDPSLIETLTPAPSPSEVP